MPDCDVCLSMFTFGCSAKRRRTCASNPNELFANGPQVSVLCSPDPQPEELQFIAYYLHCCFVCQRRLNTIINLVINCLLRNRSAILCLSVWDHSCSVFITYSDGTNVIQHATTYLSAIQFCIRLVWHMYRLIITNYCGFAGRWVWHVSSLGSLVKMLVHLQRRSISQSWRLAST